MYVTLHFKCYIIARVSDGHSYTDNETISFTVNIEDSNDNHPTFSQESTPEPIAETDGIGRLWSFIDISLTLLKLPFVHPYLGIRMVCLLHSWLGAATVLHDFGHLYI